MSHPLMRVLASRWLTFACFAVIIALGAVLTTTVLTATRTETALRARIAALGSENRQAAAVWRAKLAACEVGAVQRGSRVTPAALSNEARAKELAQKAPAGFDVCARMESADRAVLETLK
jgi:hypothetical protein